MHIKQKKFVLISFENACDDKGEKSRESSLGLINATTTRCYCFNIICVTTIVHRGRYRKMSIRYLRDLL